MAQIQFPELFWKMQKCMGTHISIKFMEKYISSFKRDQAGKEKFEKKLKKTKFYSVHFILIVIYSYPGLYIKM